MRAGELKHRITFWDKVVVQDGYGQETIVWTEAFTAWGAIEPLLGREFLEAQSRAEASVTARIRIRQREGITPVMRASWSSHIYDIEGVLPVKTDNREIVLMVNEVLSWEA